MPAVAGIADATHTMALCRCDAGMHMCTSTTQSVPRSSAEHSQTSSPSLLRSRERHRGSSFSLSLHLAFRGQGVPCPPVAICNLAMQVGFVRLLAPGASLRLVMRRRRGFDLDRRFHRAGDERRDVQRFVFLEGWTPSRGGENDDNLVSCDLIRYLMVRSDALRGHLATVRTADSGRRARLMRSALLVEAEKAESSLPNAPHDADQARTPGIARSRELRRDVRDGGSRELRMYRGSTRSSAFFPVE